MKKFMIASFFVALSAFMLIAPNLFATTLSKKSISVAICDPCFLNKQSDKHKADLFFVIDEDSEELKKLKIKIGKNIQVFDLKSNDGEYPITNFGEYDIHITDLNGDDFLDLGLGVPSTPRNPNFLYLLYAQDKNAFVILGQYGYLTPESDGDIYLERVITPRYYEFKENYYRIKNEKLELVKGRSSTIGNRNQLATISEIEIINGKKKMVGTKLLPIQGSTLLIEYFNDLTIAHKTSLKYFRRKDLNRSISNMEGFFVRYEYPLIFLGDNLSKKNLNIINDYAFFLEQGKRYKESIEILNHIIKKSPQRIVAYINLGDSYYGNNEADKAKQAYQKYVDLMKKADKQKRIPKRVYARLK